MSVCLQGLGCLILYYLFLSFCTVMLQDLNKRRKASFTNVGCDTAVHSVIMNNTKNIPLEFLIKFG